MCGLFTTYFSWNEKRVQSRLRWCVLFNCVTDQMTDRTALNGPWLLRCIRCSYVCQRNTKKCSHRKAPPTWSRLTQQRSLVKRKKQNLARNRHVITSQTCQDKVKKWVTADFVNVSRRVSVNCNSTFCSDVYLDFSVDAASLNNSEELHIINFQLQTCVRRPQSLKCLY